MDRDALKALIVQKDAMEREIMEISDALEANNMGGVRAPLVDAEGFPRADVDVHATRTLRNRLAILNTDHKALMQRIEQGLLAVHGAASTASTLTSVAPSPARHLEPPPAPPVPSSATGPTPPTLATSTAPAFVEVDDGSDMEPFALIDEVFEDSPAAAAGLCVGDRLLKFGSLHAGNHDQLRALARLTQRSVGSTIALLVLRDDTRVVLQLLPRRWSGNGLLGCHLQPLFSS